MKILNDCGIDVFNVTPYVEENRNREIVEYLRLYTEVIVCYFIS